MGVIKQKEYHSFFYNWLKWKRNRSHYRHFNLVKFYFISVVLDILVKCRYKDHMEAVPYSYISRMIHNQYAIPEFMSKVNHDECIGIVAEMEWMGLIKLDFDNQESLILTDKGLRMYETQHYHSIYSSLLEAQVSRTLSKNAMIFAGISAIIAIISLLYNLMELHRCGTLS